jgi:hypothetical protein
LHNDNGADGADSDPQTGAMTLYSYISLALHVSVIFYFYFLTFKIDMIFKIIVELKFKNNISKIH